MDSAGVATVLVAALGVLQVVLLAIINRRQTTMAHNLNSHLTSLMETQATEAELEDRE